jgi:hypothetical protein
VKPGVYRVIDCALFPTPDSDNRIPTTAKEVPTQNNDNIGSRRWEEAFSRPHFHDKNIGDRLKSENPFVDHLSKPYSRSFRSRWRTSDAETAPVFNAGKTQTITCKGDNHLRCVFSPGKIPAEHLMVRFLAQKNPCVLSYLSLHVRPKEAERDDVEQLLPGAGGHVPVVPPLLHGPLGALRLSRDINGRDHVLVAHQAGDQVHREFAFWKPGKHREICVQPTREIALNRNGGLRQAESGPQKDCWDRMLASREIRLTVDSPSEACLSQHERFTLNRRRGLGLPASPEAPTSPAIRPTMSSLSKSLQNDRLQKPAPKCLTQAQSTLHDRSIKCWWPTSLSPEFAIQKPEKTTKAASARL